jgi:hypothetical protein
MRRASRAFAAAAVVLAIHCGSSHDASFTHDGDDAFVASIEGSYAATTRSGATVTLRLCEDTSPNASACIVADIGTASDCPSECHLIRSGGRSKEESLPVEKTGCGCAGAHADMPLSATLGLGGAVLRMTGTVNLSPSESEPYGEPRRIFASAASARTGDRTTGADASGFFRHDGKLELSVRASATPVAEVADGAADASRAAADGGGEAPAVVVSGEKLLFTKVPATDEPCDHGAERSP